MRCRWTPPPGQAPCLVECDWLCPVHQAEAPIGPGGYTPAPFPQPPCVTCGRPTRGGGRSGQCPSCTSRATAAIRQARRGAVGGTGGACAVGEAIGIGILGLGVAIGSMALVYWWGCEGWLCF